MLMAYISESTVSVKTERVRSSEREKHRERRKSVKRRDIPPRAGETYYVYRHSSSRRRDRHDDQAARDGREGRTEERRRAEVDRERLRSDSSSSRSSSSTRDEGARPVVLERRQERPTSPVIVKRVPMLSRTQSMKPRVERVVLTEAPKLSRTTSMRESAKTQRVPLKRSQTTTTRTTTTTPARRVSTRESRPPVTETKVVERRESAPSTVQDRRRSVGLFSSLFGPSYTPRTPEKKVECLTCLSDVPISKSARLSCGHNMCHGCLKRIFVLSVSDPQHMPPRCCTQDHIPLKHVDRLFNVKFKIQWNRKYQEYTSKNRIYCPARGCGEWIKPAHIYVDDAGRKYGKCSRCKTKVCCMCNRQAHGRRECPKDEETNRFFELAQQQGWRRCGNCGATVERKEGCNHMTCRCTAQFCILCGSRWKTCSCPWFNYENIETDRLQHMNVAEQAQVPVEQAPNHPPDYNAELERRRRQEEEDEMLARRMQTLNMDLAEDGYVGGNQGIYSVGNTQHHFVNQNFIPTRELRRRADYLHAAAIRDLRHHQRRESAQDWRRPTTYHPERPEVEVLHREPETNPLPPPQQQQQQQQPPVAAPLYTPITRTRTLDRRGYEGRRRSTLAGLTRGRGQAGGRVAAWLKYIGDGLPEGDLDQDIPVSG